jgi:thiamine-phosphate pyrophosphorylase
MSSLRFPRGLYGVTPEWDDTKRLMTAVQQAAQGGMTSLQLRRKTATPAERAAQARALAPLCRELGVVFLINDDWRLALEVGADGAHLGRDDGDPAEVRKQAGAGLILGVSCYNDLDLARRLLDANPDYIAFGAAFPSSVKPQAVRAPLTLYAQACQLAAERGLPRAAVVAIGGITPENAPVIAAAGADAIAVITGLFEAPIVHAAAMACSAPYANPIAAQQIEVPERRRPISVRFRH